MTDDDEWWQNFSLFPLNLIKNATLHGIKGLNPLGTLLGPSQGPLGTLLGPSQGPLGTNLAPSWGPLGEHFGGHFSLFLGFLSEKASRAQKWAVLMRFGCPRDPPRNPQNQPFWSHFLVSWSWWRRQLVVSWNLIKIGRFISYFFKSAIMSDIDFTRKFSRF